MFGWFVENHDALEALGGLAGFLSLIGLIFGGLFGVLRLLKDRKEALNHSARALYYEYCRMSIDNPEYFLEFWDRSDISEIERERYVRFVCYMINGIEDVYASSANIAWRVALKEDFRPHVSFLSSASFTKLRPYFFAETCQVIDAVIAEERTRSHA